MAKYWVLAADSTEARLFTREKKFAPLHEQHDWLHPESRLHGRELEEDRQGRTFASHGPGQSEKQKRTEPKKREAAEFAGELARFLNAARGRGEFEALSIVAEPTLLGLLRERLDPGTRRCVDRTVDKNLTRQAPEQIAEALDQPR